MSSVDKWASVWAALPPPPAARQVRLVIDGAVERGEYPECMTGLLRHAFTAANPPEPPPAVEPDPAPRGFGDFPPGF